MRARTKKNSEHGRVQTRCENLTRMWRRKAY